MSIKNIVLSLSRLSIIILSLFVVATFIICAINYFLLTKNKQSIENELANIHLIIEKDIILIPSIIKIINKSTKNEKITLAAIQQDLLEIQKNHITLNSNEVNSLKEKQNKINSIINRLLSISYTYPSIKSNDDFINLKAEVDNNQNKANIARIYYNRAATKYNSELVSFFGAIVNRTLLHYEPVEYFG